MNTNLEIFTNPGDLELKTSQDKDSGMFAFGIFRGPGHNYKPMFITEPFAEAFEDVVAYIEETLRTVCEVVTKELEDPQSLILQILNPDDREIDQSKVLTPELITRILKELRQNKSASTHKMFADAS